MPKRLVFLVSHRVELQLLVFKSSEAKGKLRITATGNKQEGTTTKQQQKRTILSCNANGIHHTPLKLPVCMCGCINFSFLFRMRRRFFFCFSFYAAHLEATHGCRFQARKGGKKDARPPMPFGIAARCVVKVQVVCIRAHSCERRSRCRTVCYKI